MPTLEDCERGTKRGILGDSLSQRRFVVLQSSSMGRNRLKMLRQLKPRIRRRSTPGAKPGLLTIQPGAKPTTLRVMAYDKDRVLEKQIDQPGELQELLSKWPVVWVD